MTGPERKLTDQAERIGGGTHLFLLLFIVLVAGILVWAYLGRLDVVSSAMGEVIPSSQVKSVQHLEGGIVGAIHVREGQRVKTGEPLISLEPMARGVDVEELKNRIIELRADIARLKAEAEGADSITFDGTITTSHPGLVRQATKLFSNRRSRLQNQLKAQRETITQRLAEIRAIKARLAKQRATLILQREQIAISVELLKDDLTNRMLHVNLLKEAADLTGRIAEDEAAVAQADAAVMQARSRLDGIRDAFQEEVSGALEEKTRAVSELTNRSIKFQDTLTRTVLRSPVDGVVKTLYVVTVGGVVQPGGTVADVVPEGDRLVVEAMLPSQEVGYVRAGQKALIQLASADAARFGYLSGEVVRVSPDTIDTKDGYSYYRVRIETERDYFERKGTRYDLVPGVRVTCAIRTGERSVLEYLLDPFLRSMGTALRER